MKKNKSWTRLAASATIGLTAAGLIASGGYCAPPLAAGR